MVEHRNAVRLEQLRADRWPCRPRAGSVMPRNSVGNASLEPGGLDGAECGQRLHQRLRRAARLGGDDEARAVEIEARPAPLRASRDRGCRRSGCAAAVFCASSAMPGMFQPPSCASVWPPRLEPPMPKKTMAVGALPRACASAASASAMSCGLLGDAQQGQAAGVVVVLQGLERGREPVEPARQLGLGAGRARRCAFEAARDRLPVGRVDVAPAQRCLACRCHACEPSKTRRPSANLSACHPGRPSASMDHRAASAPAAVADAAGT